MERDEDGRTVLHWGVMWGELDLGEAEALLAAGADPMARDKIGYTVLDWAVETEELAVFQALLAADASWAEARLNNGSTLLHSAVFFDSTAVIALLLEAGAKVDARNRWGRTPLHGAATYHKAGPAIKALLAAGASLEARDEDGNTPLHRAAKYAKGYVSSDEDPHAGDAIEALLDAGASPLARNAEGKTPWDLAQANEKLKGSDAYWRLNEARFGAPPPGARRTQPASPASGGGSCEIPNYPRPPGGVANLGFSWCAASVSMQARAFALQAAGGAMRDRHGQLFDAGANPGPAPGNRRGVRASGGAGRIELPLPGRLRAVNRLQLGTVPRTGGYVN